MIKFKIIAYTGICSDAWLMYKYRNKNSSAPFLVIRVADTGMALLHRTL
ncbi:hypothetical protein [Wolbachia endosymbiont (group A) of Anomoia purmunda]|nr:hypothetical protein [Wolbachia endosymbiont (group A) of Anomoia purmunda]